MTRTSPPQVSDSPFRRALVVGNPISGKGHGAKAAREMSEGLQRRGIASSVFLTSGPGDAFTHLRTLREPVDLVVSVGGDGTLREVLEGLVEPETAVGMLPLGTANVLAKELGLPRDIHHSLEIILRNRVTSVDVAKVNGKLSLLMTGIGIDALVVREVERKRRGPITKWNYVGAALRALHGYRAPRLSVAVDGKPIGGNFGFVLVGNAMNYGGYFRLAPDARMDDGRLEIYLFPTGTRRELAVALGRSLFGRMLGGAVSVARGQSISVSSPVAVPFQVDGDLAGETPVEIQVAPNRYRLVVP